MIAIFRIIWVRSRMTRAASLSSVLIPVQPLNLTDEAAFVHPPTRRHPFDTQSRGDAVYAVDSCWKGGERTAHWFRFFVTDYSGCGECAREGHRSATSSAFPA